MKLFKLYFVYALFFSLIICSGYLFSLRWNFVPWGSGSNDGLFFLFYYIAVLPLLIITSIAKRILLKKYQNSFLKNSFFFYTATITLPAIDTYGSQTSLALGTCFCIMVSISILVEWHKLRTQFILTM